jgi:hypothetical protein
VHILFGGAFEQRTVIAMTLRTSVWLAISGVAWKEVVRMKDVLALKQKTPN